MDDQNKNLILATALSFVVILIWFVLFPPPEPEAPLTTDSTEAQAPVPSGGIATEGGVPLGSDLATADATAPTETQSTQADAPRVAIETPRLAGSLSMLGGRIDDLSLKDYNTTNDADADIVRMLAPVGESDAYYAVYGWVPGGGLDAAAVPGPDTLWTVTQGDTLSANSPVTLQWDNGAGLLFERQIAVDEQFMFTVTQSVTNTGDTDVRAAPYGMIAHHGIPDDIKNFFILHEGAVAQAGDELLEINWDDIAEADVNAAWGRPAIVQDDVQNGWVGFTEHYWQAILIPGQGTGFDQALTYAPRADVYRAITRLPTQDIAAGATVSVETQFFAGAKEWEVLRSYESAGVENFIDSIDWGWFFFLTKPIFWLLHELNLLIGNMGWAIIGLTLIIKAVLVPLAYKSYVSMAKMKELQPQMEALKEKAGEDRQKLQQGMMELYKKEKVNPAAGCLPILLQIPIFFSLYKVIFVTIELRHAPFFGPFQDLSAPDPTSIINLWGLLPFAGPEPGSIMALIFIGILPLLLGISMWLQQKLNPAPTDPTQQMIFAWMPWIFMFMLGSFASGLVVYWIANNVITFTQQYLIMRSQGYKPDLLGNITSGLKKKVAEDPKK
ncbi:membrane protein insertase YidC [uncultured Tateyamaria sp.]|uniref:membrane protein insertase YidC n=1 Tax=Tateyamaria sp. 1078 TaxID=3417464 RepID=UPI00260FDA89|nr:membrane protein insertase YidC [uncultured Tateyamaria sp.]